MNNQDLLKLDNQLCHRFYTVSNAFTRAYRPLLKELDITYPQYLVLLTLWEQDALSISELVEKSKIDPGALTLILKKMEQKDFISIVPGQSDKRVKQITLTQKGKKAKETAASIPQQLLCKMQNLSGDELTQLKNLIDKLYCDLTQ